MRQGVKVRDAAVEEHLGARGEFFAPHLKFVEGRGHDEPDRAVARAGLRLALDLCKEVERFDGRPLTLE